jgi:hypothetical protein
VTKTKESHHRPTNKAPVIAKAQWPETLDGGQLAKEVQASTRVTSEAKVKLIREILDHEGSHGQCTQTFLKKVRKQIRAPSSP